MKLVSGALLQFRYEVLIERAGSLALRVNQKPPTTNVIAESEQTAHDVNQETGAQPLSFMPRINAQSSQERHWLWIASGSLLYAVRCRREV